MAEAVVEFDYDAEQEDELTLRVGDVIRHVVTAEGGWWEGELKGKKGMFPENFVKLKTKDGGAMKEEKREATQRKSVRELANKFKDGVPMPGAQGSVIQKKKETTKTKKCKVMYEYKPENEDELELIVGQIVDFNKEVEDGWWEGSVNGKIGVFPSNFVELIEDGDGEQTSAANSTGDKDPNFQEIKGKKVMGIGLGNIFQGGPIKLRNTTKKTEAGKPGKLEEKDKEPKLPTSNPLEASKREKQGVMERAVVRFSYAAEQPDELSLKEGEIIRILDKNLEDEGWWRGEVHGKVGVFPDNFVELLPAQDEPSKAPKKPPPPTGKHLYPKLSDSAATAVDEKNVVTRKEQARRKSGLTKHRVVQDEAVPDKPTPTASLKKPLAPPPVGKKPGVPQKAAEAPSRPDPPKPSESSKVELRNKELSNNHHAPSDSNKAEDGEETSFDAVETSSQKLVHLTASRAKGPKKRPPSTVVFSSDVNDGSEAEEKNVGNNHVQPEKPPPAISKDHKTIPTAEAYRSNRYQSSHETLKSSATPDPHVHKTTAPPRPAEPACVDSASGGASAYEKGRIAEDEEQRKAKPEPSPAPLYPHPTCVQHVRDHSRPELASPATSALSGFVCSAFLLSFNDSSFHTDYSLHEIREEFVHVLKVSSSKESDAAALARLVEDLQREVRDLRAHTVSKNEYNDLRSDYLHLKQDFEVFKASCSKKLREFMMEVDEEKKLRLNTQVEIERVKKMLAETHV